MSVRLVILDSNGNVTEPEDLTLEGRHQVATECDALKDSLEDLDNLDEEKDDEDY